MDQLVAIGSDNLTFLVRIAKNGSNPATTRSFEFSLHPGRDKNSLSGVMVTRYVSAINNTQTKKLTAQ